MSDKLEDKMKNFVIYLFVLTFGISLLCFLSFEIGRKKSPFSCKELEEASIYYYMSGWNNGIESIYASKEWKELGHFPRVGCFTGVDKESVSEIVKNRQWSWKKMEYKH